MTKNASCSELGDENASCIEHRGSQLEGDDGSIYVASPPASASRAMTSEQQDYPSTKDLHAVLLSFAQLAIGCSNPTLNKLITGGNFVTISKA